MSIAVYSRNSEDGLDFDPFNILIINYLKRWLGQEQLLVLSSAPVPAFPGFEPGVQVIPLAQKRGRFLDRSLERKWTLPRLLKKHHIRALIWPDAKRLLSTPVPQFLLLRDTALLQKKDPALQQFAAIVVSSGFLKAELVKSTGVPPDKVIVVEGLLMPGLGPLEITAQLEFKDRVTEGREFFICADTQWSREQLLTLLKAFSQFKKMQQSGWKLLLTQRGCHPRSSFSTVFDVLDTYKYREDVVLFESSETSDYAAAMGAAYAAITFQQDGGFAAAACEALVCHVPVVAPAAGTLPQYPDLFLFDAVQDMSLAQRLMELYKDEGVRRQFIQRYVAHPLKLEPETGLSLLKKRLLQA